MSVHRRVVLRQFHQIGVECFGSSNPATDVEAIALWQLISWKEIGIQGVKLHLNTFSGWAVQLQVKPWSTIWHRSRDLDKD